MSSPHLSLSNPQFSIIIPTFNRSDVVLRAVRSVLDQTFPNFELIVMDDGSTDDTKEVISQVKDPRFIYFYQQNSGCSAARNAGASKSRGTYLAFLDSDDEAYPEWLHHFHDAFQKDRVGLVSCGADWLLDTGERRQSLPKTGGPHYHYQVGRFLAGSFAVRRDLFLAVEGYHPELAYSENSDLAIRLVDHCMNTAWKVTSVQQPLLLHHRRPLVWAKNPDLFRLRLRSAKYMLERHGNSYLPASPDGYANYCAIAGVNAARLGNSEEARRFFAAAIKVFPWNWKAYIRYALALLPAISRRYWLRFCADSDE